MDRIHRIVLLLSLAAPGTWSFHPVAPSRIGRSFAPLFSSTDGEAAIEESGGARDLTDPDPPLNVEGNFLHGSSQINWAVRLRWLDCREAPPSKFQVGRGIVQVYGHTTISCPLSELVERAESCLGNNMEIPILVFADDMASSAKAIGILKDAGFNRCVDGGVYEEVEQVRLDMIKSKPNLQGFEPSSGGGGGGGRGGGGLFGLFGKK